ncbi:MAG: hypothetical protein M0Q48_09865 [Verrucomicrobia bacterium]|nr:hypothetical protein [Verrucomicrobiota bacterium]
MQLDFQYDWMGRRISKTVKTNGVTSYSRKFLYDGWNLIAELDGNNALVRAYTWGLDASGSMQGAGGVGGLLMVNAGSGGVHFPAYDLNGNVMGLVNAANGNISAKYEYGPFGEVFCSVGDMASVNPFQFSTKYTDSETDLVYYGYRYYSPALGRWLSRDPIEEQGGLNLYGFVNNDPVNRWDRLGMWSHSHDCAEDQLELLRNTEEGAKKCLAEWSKFFKSLDNFNYENFFYGEEFKNLTKENKEEIRSFNEEFKKKIDLISIHFNKNEYEVECECNCDSDTKGYVNKNWIKYGIIDDDIHFCPFFFRDNFIDQKAIFIHEMTHYYFNTKDKNDLEVGKALKPLIKSLEIAQFYESLGRSCDQKNIKKTYKDWLKIKQF